MNGIVDHASVAEGLLAKALTGKGHANTISQFQEAIGFAKCAHMLGDQPRRKYTNEPYIVHPLEVDIDTLLPDHPNYDTINDLLYDIRLTTRR